MCSVLFSRGSIRADVLQDAAGNHGQLEGALLLVDHRPMVQPQGSFDGRPNRKRQFWVCWYVRNHSIRGMLGTTQFGICWEPLNLGEPLGTTQKKANPATQAN